MEMLINSLKHLHEEIQEILQHSSYLLENLLCTVIKKYFPWCIIGNEVLKSQSTCLFHYRYVIARISINCLSREYVMN